jgi:arylsulfatase A-like enzyme
MRPGRLLLSCLLPLLLCAAAAAQQPNVLLIIADDLGVDRVGAYATVPDPGHTPRIDALAAQGILFRNAYANPVCSPTRATLLTGRYGFRTGIGLAMNYFLDTFELPASETCLPQALVPAMRSSLTGKWHMGAQKVSGLLHPLLVGFEHHLGVTALIPGFINDGYYLFSKNVDGIESLWSTYNTTDTVDDALAQIGRFGSDPWCLWVTFHAPHAPFHKPPSNLHTFNLPASVSGNIPIHMKAMTEAMDTEIGRMLDSMDPAVLARTIIIFIGDNGTDKPAASPPLNPDKLKGTVYEGGIHVPLIVAGPGIAAGATCSALVNSTDLYATIAEIAGVPHPTATDSVSLVPYFTDPAQRSLRDFAYAEIFQPNGYGPYTSRKRATRGERFKLIWNYTLSDVPSSKELYDLQSDPAETANLLLSPPLSTEAAAALAELTAVLVAQKLPWVVQGYGLAGSGGVPLLEGTGALVGGEHVTLSLTGARPGSPASLVIGLSYILKNFKGGVMVPSPDIMMPGLLTDQLGSVVLGATWPADMPPDLNMYLQCWIADPGGPKGFSASNSLHVSTP